MKTHTVYLSAGINPTKKSLDWSTQNNLIAYAASNHIILYDVQEGCIVGVSDESHGNYINCVHWVKNGDTNNNYLLSTSSDGSSKLWVLEVNEASRIRDHITSPLKALATLTGHKGSVSSGYAVLLPSEDSQKADKIFVVTTGEDYFINAWKVDAISGESEELFNYKLPGRSLALDVLVIPSPKSVVERHWPLVVYGGDDGHLHLMTSTDGRTYVPSLVLSGHQDWVTTISYTIEDEGDILLSSGSKDGLIRLWRLSNRPTEGRDQSRTEEEEEELLQVKVLPMKVPKVKVCSEREDEFVALFCSLESVLHGHDGLVSGLDWDWFERGDCERLLSCSKTEDRSVVIWEPEVEDADELGSGIWVEKVRLGEVGGNREGFFCAKFGPNRDQIAAVSYQGGFHLWRRNQEDGTWVPQPVVSGHFGEVVDLDWDKAGRYLLSVSKDQTTRLHAQWVQSQEKSVWQEMARPQVHGFDMACVACLGGFGFASAGEEKVIRGFTATRNFVRRLADISDTRDDVDVDCLNLPESASVPSLGLSNKGEHQHCETGDEKEGTSLKGPPTEDELMLGTLWPEVSKLYGHGNELLSLAASSDAALLASSCRATTDLDAKIILW